MKILIIDDNQDFALKLKEDLSSQLKQTIDLVFTIKEDFDEKSDISSYDAVFLDIRLKNTSGIEIAKIIREKHHHITIIFISAFNDLVFDTFLVQPFYFLRKDAYNRDLGYLVELFNQTIIKNYIEVTQHRKVKAKISTKSIIYIETYQHTLSIHTKDDTYYSSLTLSEFMKNLGRTFVRVHRSYIINMDEIVGIDKGEVILSNNERIPISKKYKEDFKNIYEKVLMG